MSPTSTNANSLQSAVTLLKVRTAPAAYPQKIMPLHTIYGCLLLLSFDCLVLPYLANRRCFSSSLVLLIVCQCCGMFARGGVESSDKFREGNFTFNWDGKSKAIKHCSVHLWR